MLIQIALFIPSPLMLLLPQHTDASPQLLLISVLPPLLLLLPPLSAPLPSQHSLLQQIPTPPTVPLVLMPEQLPLPLDSHALLVPPDSKLSQELVLPQLPTAIPIQVPSVPSETLVIQLPHQPDQTPQLLVLLVPLAQIPLDAQLELT